MDKFAADGIADFGGMLPTSFRPYHHPFVLSLSKDTRKSCIEVSLRRKKLIWFALGAAASALVMLLTWVSMQAFAVAADDTGPYLHIADRPYQDGDQSEIDLTGSQILRDCGAQFFYIRSSGGPHTPPYSFIKLAEDNDEVIDCILRRGPAEGHALSIEWLTDSEVRHDR